MGECVYLLIGRISSDPVAAKTSAERRDRSSASLGQAPPQSPPAAIRSAPAFPIESGGENDNIGRRLGKEPDLCRGLLTAANNDDATAGNFVKGREDGELAGG